uniref:Cytochrome c oxidase subunit 3 n=1 Tax=Jesogammarus hinumensis TaxID=378308 RepID=A0A891ZK86_9CRUS|nr:cytochrome c oxidase subunit III [Jesogammarus hinumensis]QRN71581.1 cytochrome c oxidase subunit III [Jesogammarus hinumensis]
MSLKTNHPYHLVEKSPWPLTSSLSATWLTSGLAKWFNTFNPSLLLVALLSIFISSTQWWRDTSRESTLMGDHTIKVTTGLRWGMILFILSEVLFFFSFFWAFFNTSLTPTEEIGDFWPPVGVYPFNPFQIPLINTIILLLSGFTVTWAHHSIMKNMHNETVLALATTIMLGVIFTTVQAMEYKQAPFSIADSAYGSTFFVATGFHGLHVLIGTAFLLTSLARNIFYQFSNTHHMGLEAAIWYWHFVDVVWLFLYLSIYWWGS